eukprot:gene4608-5214_t
MPAENQRKRVDEWLLGRSALGIRIEKHLEETLASRRRDLILEEEQDGDNVDGPNRDVGDITPRKASLCDYVFALSSSFMFFTDIVTDALVAYQHYGNGDYNWFGLTLAFIVLPSISMQIFSCKWLRDDYIALKWWTYVLHFCQLGTIQRYFKVFHSGFKTRNQEKVLKEDYAKFLKEWRDITLLRLFEGFMEAAPQTILQLYILTSSSEFILSRDWLTATSAVVSVISLSWSIVSYSQMMFLCLNDKSLSYCGYMFQILYRLFMVSSRVIVLVLFSSAFKEYVFIFIFIHCCVMFAWINLQDTEESLQDEDCMYTSDITDKLFNLIVSIIYLFCFMTTKGRTTRCVISIFYTVMFVESVALMAAWFTRRTLDGVLLYASFGVVFGGFILGVLCMMMYYKYFYPQRDITEGWFTCCAAKEGDADSETGDAILKKSSYTYSPDKSWVNINVKGKKHDLSLQLEGTGGCLKRSSLKTPLTEDIELKRPPSPRKRLSKKSTFDEEEWMPNEATTPRGSPSTSNYKYSRSQDGLSKHGTYDSPTVVAKARQPVTATKEHARQKQNWHASVSKTKDLSSRDNNVDSMAHKNEIRNIMMKNQGSGDLRIQANDNNQRKYEKKALLDRQASKDDTCLVNTRSAPSFERRYSLPERALIRQNLYAWVTEQMDRENNYRSNQIKHSDFENRRNDKLATFV